MNLDEGKKLVRLARHSVEVVFNEESIENKKFLEKRGVFVSLRGYPDGELRGCIGFIEPKINLSEAVMEAARSAAFGDPRFIPLRKEELNNVVFEVSVLTGPVLVEDVKEIKIGRDGLIVEKDEKKGLLLPQVFKDESVEGALRMTCRKAGLDEESWKDCKICRFGCKIFKEKKPNGEIVDGS